MSLFFALLTIVSTLWAIFGWPAAIAAVAAMAALWWAWIYA